MTRTTALALCAAGLAICARPADAEPLACHLMTKPDVAGVLHINGADLSGESAQVSSGGRTGSRCSYSAADGRFFVFLTEAKVGPSTFDADKKKLASEGVSVRAVPSLGPRALYIQMEQPESLHAVEVYAKGHFIKINLVRTGSFDEVKTLAERALSRL